METNEPTNEAVEKISENKNKKSHDENLEVEKMNEQKDTQDDEKVEEVPSDVQKFTVKKKQDTPSDDENKA